MPYANYQENLLDRCDQRLIGCNQRIEVYKLMKAIKEKKIELQKCREKMIVDFDMDYKTIEQRLTQEFPEFIPVDNC